MDRQLDYNGDKELNHVTGRWKRKAYHLTEQEVRFVMNATENNYQASIMLDIRPETWKKYANMYVDHESGKTLFELHKQKAHIKHDFGNIKVKKANIYEVMEGKKHYYSKESLQKMLIAEGLMEERCVMCGFNERRITDYKIPLLLMWKDGNTKNNKLENLELVCFNHAFLYYNKTAPNCSLQNRAYEYATWHYLLKNGKDDEKNVKRLRELDAARAISGTGSE